MDINMNFFFVLLLVLFEWWNTSINYRKVNNTEF